jgi:hypothetical protein
MVFAMPTLDQSKNITSQEPLAPNTQVVEYIIDLIKMLGQNLMISRMWLRLPSFDENNITFFWDSSMTQTQAS